MCGLTGALAARLPALAALQKMADSLFHRGPDDGDVWLDNAAGIALGHRRLAILDLSPAGHQPMLSECGRFVIAFNGEIYNHLELRDEMESAGYPTAWRGHSDTETLLACIVAWGIKATLVRAVGMFAIALWDREERRLHLARDRFGEKPLYYGWTRGAFVFASELKALRRYPEFDNPIDRNVVALYLQFCYVPAPYAIYRHVFKLEPGCLLSLSLADAASPPSAALEVPTQHGGLTIERYWSLAGMVQRGLANPFQDEREAVLQLETALSNAVCQQSFADVPLGAFLSGGIDSSTIVALMQAQASKPVRTFTIGFDDANYNEAEHAKEVAKYLGTEHTELYVTSQQARDVIPLLPDMYCEPFADSSQIPTYLVSRMARRHVSVSLSGDAGDELFCGYNRYFWGRRIWRRVSWMPPTTRRMLAPLLLMIPTRVWDAIAKGLPGALRVARLGDKVHKLGHRLMTISSQDDLYRSLVSEWTPLTAAVPGAQPIRIMLDDPATVQGVSESEQRMMVWDALTYLPDDILHKVDRAAMAVSLETRVPFLDHRVAELAWRIPLNMKIREGQGKWILRQVLYKYIPKKLVERPKAGFGLPLSTWLRGPLRDWAEDLLSEESLSRHGMLDNGRIRRTWQQHVAGTHEWTARLWAVLMLQAWLAKGSA